MSLRKCSHCQKEVARSASTCPHCGGRLTVTPWGALILGGILALGAAAWWWGTG